MGELQRVGEQFKPVLTHEQMWNQLSGYVAELSTQRRAPKQVFFVREMMGELERQRARPMREYIRAQRKGLEPCLTSLNVNPSGKRQESGR